MLTLSPISTNKNHQIPLFPGSLRINEVLLSPHDEYERIHRLLNDWADQYGKVSIQVDQTAIIMGEYRIALEDISPKNALRNGIETFNDVSFSPQGNLLTAKPGSIDMINIETWMIFIDRIPGEWSERRDNLLNLLGNECFPHKDGFYGDGYNDFFVYHTGESLWDDDGHYYWQLFIRSLPIPLEARHCSDFIGEYTKCPIDHELWNWGDGYIHFDAFNSAIAPPAAIRLQG